MSVRTRLDETIKKRERLGAREIKRSKGGPKWLSSRSDESNLRCENEQGELQDLAVAEDDNVGVKCIYGLTK